MSKQHKRYNHQHLLFDLFIVEFLSSLIQISHCELLSKVTNWSQMRYRDREYTDAIFENWLARIVASCGCSLKLEKVTFLNISHNINVFCLSYISNI